MEGKNRWNERYTAEGYFWDKVPLPICRKLIEIIKPSASYRPKLIDLGCGEGGAYPELRHKSDKRACGKAFPPPRT